MIAKSPPVFFLHLGLVTGWTYTEYLSVVSTQGLFDLSSTVSTLTVSPTGPVSPTATSTATAQTAAEFDGEVSLNITVTELYLGPDASVCTPSGYSFTCSESTTASTPLNNIVTSVWVPVTISNPSTCTQTAFTYTTSSFGSLGFCCLGDTMYFPGLFNQATDTGSGGEALFTTTYISTVSVDLGGQSTTVTRCDAWLKNGALLGVLQNDAEEGYLSQCVDPRRYLCPSQGNSLGNCGTDWVGTYPATPGAATNTGGVSSSTATRTSGVAGERHLPGGALIMAALAATASIFIFV